MKTDKEKECKWIVERGPECLFIRLRPHDLKDVTAEGLVNRLWALLEKHLTYRLMLEFDSAIVLDSEKISQLVLLSKRILQRDGMLRLSGLSRENQAVLEACNLEDLFPMYEDRHDAVMGARCQRVELY